MKKILSKSSCFINTIVLMSAVVCFSSKVFAQDAVINDLPVDLKKPFEDIIQENTNEKISETTTLSTIPDGGTLLLRPKVGALIYEYDIYALNKNDSLYYSLTDVIDIFELAIKYDDKLGKGSGWFLREDWLINIDLPNNQVVANDKTFNVAAQDVVKQDDIYFIRQDALSEWLDIQFSPDIPQQYLELTSAYPLPGVARYYRQSKQKGNRFADNYAVLPREDIKYEWFDLNTANIRTGSQYIRRDNTESNIFHRISAAFQGQFLKHEAYAQASGDSRNKLSSVIAYLAKKDEDPVLLGPLKARQYKIGDTGVTDLPLTGDARQELGFRVSNSSLDNAQFQTTDINGNALPGWDVELYRQGILVDTQLIANDGYYEFSNVQLFGGNNEFELFFYGPQGEIRQREVNVPVTPALLSAQNNTYDVSVSLNETRTFQKIKQDDPDREKPHFAARYNKVIGDALAYVGVRNRDVESTNKTFGGLGFTKLIKNTIIDANVGIDDEANMASKVGLRQNIKKWNLFLNALVQDEDYIPDEKTNVKTLLLTGGVQKNFLPVRGVRASLFGNGEYSQASNDLDFYSARLGASLQKNRYNVSNNILYQSQEQNFADRNDTIDNDLSLRGNFSKFFVRGGINFNIEPLKQVDRVYTQVNYYPKQNMSYDFQLRHQPLRDFTEARLGLNYVNDYVRASPYIEVDSDRELLIGVNINTNLIDVPYQRAPILTSDRTLGTGLVSSFVYHDKNGNKIFDEGDEALPDVTVKSVNVRRRADTNENGYSLINNLPTHRATDIELDNDTLPDPYMIAGFKGASVFADAGEIVELDFPVHLSGEIDGTISVKDQKGETNVMRRADVMLYPLSKDTEEDPIEVNAAFDGFYVASQVPPGKYLMAVSNDTTKSARAGAAVPRVVDIGYDGDVLYGYNFELDKRTATVPVNVVYDMNPSDQVIYALKASANTKTKLLSLMGSMKKRVSTTDYFADLTPLKADGLYKMASNDLETTYNRCQEMAKNAIPCQLQVLAPQGQSAEPNIKTAQNFQTSLR